MDGLPPHDWTGLIRKRAEGDRTMLADEVLANSPHTSKTSTRVTSDAAAAPAGAVMLAAALVAALLPALRATRIDPESALQSV
jgi:ABC-type antimicrobial peptide transport system permease subunit